MSRNREIYKPGFLGGLLPAGKWTVIIDPENTHQVHLGREGGRALSCNNITGIKIDHGLIWDTLVLQSSAGAFKLSGLSSEAADQLKKRLLVLINQHIAAELQANKRALVEAGSVLQAITQEERSYLSQSDVSQAVAGVAPVVSTLLGHPLFEPSRLSDPGIHAFLAPFQLLTEPSSRQCYNETFVANEMVRYEQFFADSFGVSLSNEQREACIRQEDNNILVASAGSGKTATMVAKIAYLLEKQAYQQRDILVLAFNAGAASELRERLSKQLGVTCAELGCQVTTFHALGRGIIEEVEGKPPQLANWLENQAGETRFIQVLLEEQKQSSEEFRTLWEELLLLFPKSDRPVESFDSERDYQQYISDRNQGKQATVSTLSGVYVKSLQEQTIANWLWINSIPFEYEKQVAYEDETGQMRYVRPDFYYPETQTFHEHFAINADGRSPFKDYLVHAEAKRQGYKKSGYDFFETTSAMAKDGSLLSLLQAELETRGIERRRRSDSEIEQALSPIVLRHYQSLASTSIKHIRANAGDVTLDLLLERAKSLQDLQRGNRFARVVWILAKAYQDKLDSANVIDFDSMIGDAVRHVSDGRYQSPYRMILVDEFQDISISRANLVKALRGQNAGTKLFVVGDDWQSIYGFAGSDITLFTGFTQHFGAGWQGYLQHTYRCNRLIADTAARFIQRNPEQIKKEVIASTSAIPRSIRIVPVAVEWQGDSIAKACDQVLARVNEFAGRNAHRWQTAETTKLSVLVLARYNMTNPYKFKPPNFSHLDVRSCTFHRSKGLEADYVLLLDVSEGNFGVPSRIEDDELLSLVNPRRDRYEYAEERRLFYVALTRASRGVFILCNQRQPSRYITELEQIGGEDISTETPAGEPLQKCPNCGEGYMVAVAGGSDGMLRCSRQTSCGSSSPDWAIT